MTGAAEVLTEPTHGAPPERATLASAMEHANLPTLVAVLAQLTGDRRWLADPYRPTRSRGMEDNDGGAFAPRRWSTHFGKRDEVLGYLRDVAEHHDLRPVIRFGTEVAGAAYDAVRQRWTVTTTAGEEIEGHAVITAVGQLNRPNVPDLPGLDGFRGPIFHSARWPADLDVTGKRVAVVGTGASAMQIVPAIAGRAERMTVFQRSPHWAAPNEVYFAPVDDAMQLLMERVPFYRRWYRTRLSWNTGDCTRSTSAAARAARSARTGAPTTPTRTSASPSQASPTCS